MNKEGNRESADLTRATVKIRVMKLENKLNDLKKKVNEIATTVERNSDRLTSVEESVTQIQSQVSQLQESVQKALHILSQKGESLNSKREELIVSSIQSIVSKNSPPNSSSLSCAAITISASQTDTFSPGVPPTSNLQKSISLSEPSFMQSLAQNRMPPAPYGRFPAPCIPFPYGIHRWCPMHYPHFAPLNPPFPATTATVPLQYPATLCTSTHPVFPGHQFAPSAFTYPNRYPQAASFSGFQENTSGQPLFYTNTLESPSIPLHPVSPSFIDYSASRVPSGTSSDAMSSASSPETHVSSGAPSPALAESCGESSRYSALKATSGPSPTEVPESPNVSDASSPCTGSSSTSALHEHFRTLFRPPVSALCLLRKKSDLSTTGPTTSEETSTSCEEITNAAKPSFVADTSSLNALSEPSLGPIASSNDPEEPLQVSIANSVQPNVTQPTKSSCISSDSFFTTITSTSDVPHIPSSPSQASSSSSESSYSFSNSVSPPNMCNTSFVELEGSIAVSESLDVMSNLPTASTHSFPSSSDEAAIEISDSGSSNESSKRLSEPTIDFGRLPNGSSESSYASHTSSNSKTVSCSTPHEPSQDCEAAPMSGETDVGSKKQSEVVTKSANYIPDTSEAPSTSFIPDQQSKHLSECASNSPGNVKVPFLFANPPTLSLKAPNAPLIVLNTSPQTLPAFSINAYSPSTSVNGYSSDSNSSSSCYSCPSSSVPSPVRSLGFLSLVERGEVESVTRLLASGVDVQQHNQHGDTALHIAAGRGHSEVVRALLACPSTVGSVTSGVPRLPATDMADIEGNAALVHAAKAGHWDVVQLLLQFGASVNIYKGKMNCPLLLAAKNGPCDIVREILKHVMDSWRLKYALAEARDKNVARAFADAVPNICCAEEGQWAIREAARDNRVETLMALCALNGDVNSSDKDGRTTLHHACWNGSVNAVMFILERGVDINAQDSYGRSALHYATQKERNECVRLLLEAGVDTMLKDKRGKTANDLAQTTLTRSMFPRYP